MKSDVRLRSDVRYHNLNEPASTVLPRIVCEDGFT